jgi:hypothetical protein
LLQFEEETETSYKDDEKHQHRQRVVQVVYALLLAIAFAVLIIRFIYATDFGPELETLVIPFDAVLFGATFLGLLVAYIKKFSSDGMSGRGAILRYAGAVLACVGYLVGLVVLDVSGFNPYSADYTVVIPLVAAVLGIFVMSTGQYLIARNLDNQRLTVPANVLDTFQVKGADDYFQAKKFHVFVKGKSYILLEKKFRGAYFVRLFEYMDSSQKKTSLKVSLGPLWIASAFKDSINGLPVARLEGDFTIPVGIWRSNDGFDEEKYATGSGVAYLVSMYPVIRGRFVPYALPLTERFDKATILKILDNLSAESPGKASE